jgi:hypothetical protein
MIELLSEISFRSSDRPFKSEVLTFFSILKLPAGWFVESFDFPQIILRKGGKFWLSTNYPAERHAFSQDNLRKVKTFRGFYRGKACLDAE